jgi:mitochondrial cardiolipin hydrolase
MPSEVIFTRSQSAAEAIESRIRQAAASIDVALYRFSNARLIEALRDATRRGLAIRLVLNYNDHYEENRATQAALAAGAIPFRIAHGRLGVGSKMHHKFAILDRRAVLAGSYNWTTESEERNYENLLVLDSPELVAAYAREFESLWAEARGAQA